MTKKELEERVRELEKENEHNKLLRIAAENDIIYDHQRTKGLIYDLQIKLHNLPKSICEEIRNNIENAWNMVGYEGLCFNEVTGIINKIEEKYKENIND